MNPLKACPVVVALAIATAPAYADSLKIAGTAGYLSEWEFDATVTETVSDGRKAYSGPVTWKHVGLCSVKGPQQKSGEIKFEISGWGPWSRIKADISLADIACTYSGKFSNGTKGVMNCSNAKGIPLAISFK